MHGARSGNLGDDTATPISEKRGRGERQPADLDQSGCTFDLLSSVFKRDLRAALLLLYRLCAVFTVQ